MIIAVIMVFLAACRLDTQLQGNTSNPGGAESSDRESTSSMLSEAGNSLSFTDITQPESSALAPVSVRLSDTVEITLFSPVAVEYEVTDKWVMFPEKEYLTYEEYFSEERVFYELAPFDYDYVSTDDGQRVLTSFSLWQDSVNILQELSASYIGHCAISTQEGKLFVVDSGKRTITLLLDIGMEIQAYTGNDEVICFIAGGVLFRYYVPSGTLDMLCEAGKYPPVAGNALWPMTNYEIQWKTYNEEYIYLMAKYGLGTQGFSDALASAGTDLPLQAYCNNSYNTLTREKARGTPHVEKISDTEYGHRWFEREIVEPLSLNINHKEN